MACYEIFKYLGWVMGNIREVEVFLAREDEGRRVGFLGGAGGVVGSQFADVGSGKGINGEGDVCYHDVVEGLCMYQSKSPVRQTNDRGGQKPRLTTHIAEFTTFTYHRLHFGR